MLEYQGGYRGEIDEMKQGEHDLGYINSVFDRISKNLREEVAIYHIGGNAMCWYGLKETTKDVDLVLTGEGGIDSFRSAVLDSGFIEVEIVSVPGYEHINQYAIFDEVRGIPLNQEFTPGLRVELFLDQICGGFRFSGGMTSRCVRGEDRGLLKEYFCSIDDIFLFKSITERERDLGDMNLLAERGVNWDIISDEFIDQVSGMSLPSRKMFVDIFSKSLGDFGRMHGVEIPVFVLRKVSRVL